MARKTNIGLNEQEYRRLAEDYRQQWKLSLYAMDPEGEILFGRPNCDCRNSPACRRARGENLQEACRWGEPTIAFCPRRRLIWSAPLMCNARLLGGLVATAEETDVFAQAGKPRIDARRACTDLRRLLEQHNLTNAALLETRRKEYQREQQRAEAIHMAKLTPAANVREMYLREEPALLAAIRQDDRPAAREILNRILAAIHHQAGSRLALVKSFFMELVIMMTRSAVEAGGNPDELLGANFATLAELGSIQNESRLALWLHEMLERIMDSIRQPRNRPSDRIVREAIRYMADHLGEGISRDDVAMAVGISPSHFSRMFKAEVRRSYTDLLTQMRVDRAAELLARTDRPLSLIAMETGFRDQSYFTKVFRKYHRVTPRQYRLRHG